MDLVKSSWVNDDTHIRIGVPIEKVDRARRLVSGWATLDNIDTSDDIVTAEASADAFERFVGNIREMHQPIAVGSLRKFTQETFYDTKTQKFYTGIYVTVYVSEGAEDTWKKVLDGTLRGFSIGGNIVEQSTEFSKDAGKNIRFIEKYDLVELSLVDSPANQLGLVEAIVKMEGGLFKGLAVETNLENTFWCPTHEIVKNSAELSADCPSCGNAMQQIGFIETGGDVAAKTAEVVSKFLRQKEDEAVNKKADDAHGEGGVQMTDEIKKNEEGAADESGVVTSEDVTGETDVSETPGEVTTEDEQGVEVAAEEGASEASTEPDFEKLFDDFKGDVKDHVEKTVEAVQKRVEEATTAFNEKASELEKNLSELSDKLDGISKNREEVSKRLDALESLSAIKKSGEVESEPVKKAKEGNFWGGAILNDE